MNCSGKNINKTRIRPIIILVIAAMITWPGMLVPDHLSAADGEVSWWKLDENVGTTAGDSWDANDGTVYGAKWTTGKVGRALEFDGVDDYVEVADSLGLNPDHITVEAWVYPHGLGDQIYPPVVKKAGESGSQQHGYALEIDPSDMGTYFGVFVSGVWVLSPDVVIPADTWSHLAGTYDGSSVKIYLNGTFMGETGASGNIQDSGLPLNIGRDPKNTSRIFQGKMDEVKIYDRALSNADLMLEVWGEPLEVWVDDSWCCQADVNLFDPSLTWQYDAFAVIQTGIAAVAEDGTVHVRAGKYTENLVINKSLTLQSTDGWENTNVDPLAQSTIIISGDVDVTVQGFEITTGTNGIYIGPVFSTVNILDCFIHDNAFDGIRVTSSGDVLNIQRNIISQNGATADGCGINMTQAWNTTNILDNVIGAWWGGPAQPTYDGNDEDGIRIDDVPVESDVTIADNLIVANGDDGIDFPSVISVHGSVNIEDNVIGAWVYDYGAGGVYPFAGNGDHGIHVAHVSDTGSINIEGNAISQNSNEGINFGSGVNAIYGTVTILQNFIGGWTCYSGDYGHSGSPQRYHGNGGEGIYIHQVGDTGTVTIDNNKISENGYDTGIYIEYTYGEVTIAENDIGAWEDSHGETYVGNAGQGILVNNVYSGAELTIGPDNSIKGNTSYGIDILWGQADASIEIHDNFIDDNGPKGCYCGIKLGSGGVCGAMVRDNIIANHCKGIHLDEYSTQNTIQDNEIRDNGHGVWVEGDDNQILRNDILNNVEAPSGIHLTSTAERNIIRCNNFEGNLAYGVYNENPDEAVAATGNWWGCIAGPGAAGCDLVFGNVTYDPWLPTQFQYCEECGGTPPPPPGVPMVNQYGIVAMITLFAGLLVWAVRRRRLAS